MRNCLAALLLLAGQPAFAQGGSMSSPGLPNRIANAVAADGMTNDGRAIAAADVVAILTAAQQRPARTLQPADAAGIRTILLADSSLDSAEFDLLDELANEKIRAVMISLAPGAPPAVITGTVFGQTQKVFDDMFQSHYQASWQSTDDAASWAELVRQAKFSDSAHSRVRRFLAALALEASRASNPGNQQRPATQLIGIMLKRSQALPDADRAFVTRLIYEAYIDADIAMNGTLPDYTYSWLANAPR
jgi:hypothetical protein